MKDLMNTLMGVVAIGWALFWSFVMPVMLAWVVFDYLFG